MIDDKVVKIFRNNGFQIWGGDWDFPIDYMHFQSSKALSKLLLQMEFEDAQIFFDLNVKYLRLNPQEKIGNDDLFTAMLNNCNQKEDKCVLYEYLSDTEGFLKKAKQIATKK